MPVDTLPLDQQQYDLKPTFEVRHRFERRIERDFGSRVKDDRTDHHSRVRLGVEGKSGERLKFALQYQYAHTWSDLSTRHTEDEASDVSLAFVQYKAQSVAVTLGRQKIALGSERLVGTGEWLNVPRSMDGIRLQTSDWDAFAFRIGVGQPKPQDARVIGLFGQWKYGRSMVVQKHDRVNGRSVDITTLAHEFNRKVGDWTFEAEAALQFGKVQSRTQRAWAWHASASRPVGKKTKASFEANSASGGSNADTVMTFDNLYPSNHKFYGAMDLQGWKNMDEIAVGLNHRPVKNIDLAGSWHVFSLRDPGDAWYGAGGTPNKGINGDLLDPSGSSGKAVGWEIDLEGTYRYSDDVTFGVGVGLFQPGSFVRSLNGGSSDRQTWIFFQVVARF